MNNVKSLRDKYSEKALDPEDRRWADEAQRLVASGEWVRLAGIPEGYTITKTPRTYQPGEKVVPGGAMSLERRGVGFSYYFIGTVRSGPSSSYVLLRSDGRFARYSSVTPVVTNPAVHYWNDGTVGKIAQQIIATNSWQDAPLLADALEEAGCTDRALLSLLRRRLERRERITPPAERAVRLIANHQRPSS